MILLRMNENKNNNKNKYLNSKINIFKINRSLRKILMLNKIIKNKNNGCFMHM